MDTVANLKELPETQTPLILFDFVFADGSEEHWSTHSLDVDGTTYEARVISHTVFETNLSSEHGTEVAPRIRLLVANVDSRIAQLEGGVGIRGATVAATFVFHDFEANATSDRVVLFQGLVDELNSVSAENARLSATNRLNLQRVTLPQTSIQRRCQWRFPATAAQRLEAVDGQVESRISAFYSCGYSADQVSGRGNLDGGLPFTGCARTKWDCVVRGMFDRDAAGNVTRRFGGVTFVPPSILVRPNGSKRQSASEPAVNEARYDDVIPIAYGTTWLTPPVVFARSDGNLIRLEAILAHGKLTAIHSVVVNDVEIPLGIDGANMTATGWWNLFAAGDRTGGFNLNFTDGSGDPLGDPYGSVAALSVVIPTQIHLGGGLPQIKILVGGVEVQQFDNTGNPAGWLGTNNPAWILLDILRRSGWRLTELDLKSFNEAASTCAEPITSFDNLGNVILAPRFQCNLAIRRRRAASELVRGVRNNARLQLTYDALGRLTVRVENTLGLQQPALPVGSNAAAAVNGGWPAYVYTDGSDSAPANVLADSNGRSTLQVWSRSTAETPNRLSVEFADIHNQFQQDSLVIGDPPDIERSGQELGGRLVVEGLPTYDQAIRILRYHLDRSISGNRFIQFATTVRALHQRPGDLITLTSLSEGLISQPLRIIRISPSTDFDSATIVAQIHDDAWYSDSNAELALSDGRDHQSSSTDRRPPPLVGGGLDADGFEVFGVSEAVSAAGDGSVVIELLVDFRIPTVGLSSLVGAPIVGLVPAILTDAGQLSGGQTFYYSFTAVDSAGHEGNASFVVRAQVPLGTDTNAVRINGLQFSAGATSFNAYRGLSPAVQRRIDSDVPIAPQYIDSGAQAELVGAPSPSYDHANFYWRFENLDEQFATTFSSTHIGSDLLDLVDGSMAGHVVRITRGKGRDQERVITGNDSTSLQVSPDWEIAPDLSSAFVVSDNTWQFGGSAASSPARFAVPNLSGRVIQVTGRAANAQNVESLVGISIVTRYRLGGGGLGITDSAAPPQPFFGISALRDGNLEFSGIGFADLQNTQTVSTGTFILTFADELAGPFDSLTTAPAAALSTQILVDPAVAVVAGEYVQIGDEILAVTDTGGAGTTLTVTRGECGTSAADHPVGAQVLPLKQRSTVVPFERSIFGTTAGTNWSAREWMPNVRLVCAELWLTNVFGMGPISQLSYTQLADGGLRSFRGGQYSFQIAGTLAVLSDAAPSVAVQDDTSIRDLVAVVRTEPTGGPIAIRVTADGLELAQLVILDGQRFSTAVSGVNLPHLSAQAQLGIDILAVGLSFPGVDLTVTMRL